MTLHLVSIVSFETIPLNMQKRSRRVKYFNGNSKKKKKKEKKKDKEKEKNHSLFSQNRVRRLDRCTRWVMLWSVN